jgi:transcriptional regulator with XRE-family HTH domain
MDDLILPSRIADGDFGGWLRDAMAERRISQRTLAMRTGINHSSISRLLNGSHLPSLGTAIAILKVLRPLSRNR